MRRLSGRMVFLANVCLLCSHLTPMTPTLHSDPPHLPRTRLMFADTAKIRDFSRFLPPQSASAASQPVSRRTLAKHSAIPSRAHAEKIAGYASKGWRAAATSRTRQEFAKEGLPAMSSTCEVEARSTGVQSWLSSFDSRLHDKSHEVKPVLRSSLFCCQCLGSGLFLPRRRRPDPKARISRRCLFSPAVGANPRMGVCRSLVIPSPSASCTPFIPSLSATPNNDKCAERRLNHAIVTTRDSRHSESAWAIEACLRAGASSFAGASSAAAWMEHGQFSWNQGSSRQCL